MGLALRAHDLRQTLVQWWPRMRRWVLAAFALVVIALLVSLARRVDWPGVWEALQALQGWQVAAAVGLTAASFATYGSFDLIGRKQLGLHVAPPRMMGIAAISYAFNLNLGAMLGGFGMRMRLYGRHGLGLAQVTQIVAFSMLTNWLGYLVLAGGCFVLGLLQVPPSWGIGTDGLAVLGVVLLVVAAGYLFACAFSHRRQWRLRGQDITLPTLPVALLQAGLSTANWMLIAAVISVLLPGDVHYPVVLAALTVSAIAGIVSRIPAGLGVIETVFVALMGEGMGEGPVLAALLAYRAIYYLLPLAVALVAYLRLEALARSSSPVE